MQLFLLKKYIHRTRITLYCVIAFKILNPKLKTILQGMKSLQILSIFFFFFCHSTWNLRCLTRNHTLHSCTRSMVLTTGPPGKSLQIYVVYQHWNKQICMVYLFAGKKETANKIPILFDIIISVMRKRKILVP